MAKVRDNIVVRGLSGSLGDQLIIRRSRAGRTIVSNKPTFNRDREFSLAQKNQQRAFREAAAYAQSAQEHPAYLKQARDLGISPYNLALADWFHAPEILEIDLEAWSGQAGQTIRIQALDDVQVMKVNVVIVDEAGAVLEQGPAARVDNLWWRYVTTAAAGGSPKVLASAQDLPGHMGALTKVKEA